MAPAQDPYRYFRVEARELVDQLDGGMTALEQGESGRELIQRLLRHAHTLKGAARVVKQAGIADEAHAMEDILAPLRDLAEPPSRSLVAQLNERVDTIRAALRQLAPAAPSGETSQAAQDDVLIRTIRTDLSEVDTLLDGAQEVYVRLGRVRAAHRALLEAQDISELLRAQLAPHNRTETRLAGDLDRAHGLATELVGRFNGIDRLLYRSVDQTDRELRQLRDAIEQIRLLPAARLFLPLERTADDAARTLGKPVRFEGRGGDIRLDAPLLESMQVALVQLIRNAVAHGIENEEQRRGLAKPAQGQLSLSVLRDGRDVLFECRDDGRGIDVEALRRIARERSLGGPDIARASPNELVRLLMGSGISTAQEVTTVSGRGVGLDIVREAVSRHRGTISVESEPGRGTLFRIRVPLSLSSVEALQIETGGETVAIAIDGVTNAVRISAGEIADTGEGAAILHDGEAIPFVPLASLLHEMPARENGVWSVIIVRGASGRAAVGVDRLLGTSRLVVRPLPPGTPGSAIIAGASLDAEGNAMLVLDADALVAAARSGRAAFAPPQAVALPILIIDDSLTTRMLEQSILEAAGYEVDTATSAEEGLETARARRYALFLVDVEMPGMDGFTFIERIRADPELHRIPAILVSSRNAPEDLQRGQDVGAQGYVVKGEFDQSRLLAMIAELAG